MPGEFQGMHFPVTINGNDLNWVVDILELHICYTKNFNNFVFKINIIKTEQLCKYFNNSD